MLETHSLIQDRKHQFLHGLRSNGKRDYNRYLASPLRYAGGKSLAVGYVLELLPDDVECLVSPFMGGGSVEIACAKELGIEVIAYEIFDILCIYWQIQISDPIGLASRLSDFMPDRATFANVKARLKLHWDGLDLLDDDELAAYYYFNSNTSYGPHFLGWPSDVYLDPIRYRKTVDKVRRFEVGDLTVECGDFKETIPQHPDAFLYCDPPYYLEDGKTFTGMYPHRNFPIHHKGFEHETLRDLLLNHRAGFVLSYNDCDVIRDWYADCEFAYPEWQYTFGQGDTRICANRASNGGSLIKKSHELLIWKHPG